MAAGRKTGHADAFNSPLLPFAADDPERALRILQWPARRFFLRFTCSPRNAVLEDNARDADRVQPRRDLFSFEFPIKIPISSTRTNEHRRPARFAFRRAIDRDRRL